MKYIVVIRRDSPVGQAYHHLFPSIQIGDQSHVGLACTEMDASNPVYMFVRTAQTAQGSVDQSLHLPHGNVLFVVQYDQDQKAPVGFA